MSREAKAALEAIIKEHGIAEFKDAVELVMKADDAEVTEKINRLVEIDKEMVKLKKESDGLKADIQGCAEEALLNTKVRHIKYYGDNNSSVVVQQTDSLKIVSTELVKEILKKTFGDFFTTSTEHKPKTAFKKLLIPIVKGEYMAQSISEAITGLSDDEAKLEVLRKKLKGSFKSDVKTLITVIDMDEKDAESYAYFLQEIKAYQDIVAVIEAETGFKAGTEKFQEQLEELLSAMIVEDGLKMTLDYPSE